MMHDLHKGSVCYMATFSSLLNWKLKFTLCFIVNFSFLLFVSVIIFRNIFSNLDQQHPVSPEKLLMSAESLFFPVSLNPLCPRVHPCECGCIHGDPLFSYPAWWIQLFSGWSTCGCLAVFPRLKVGKTFICFLPLRLFDGVDYQSWLDYSRVVFVDSVRVN
jgi:hypothetical protein